MSIFFLKKYKNSGIFNKNIQMYFHCKTLQNKGLMFKSVFLCFCGKKKSPNNDFCLAFMPNVIYNTIKLSLVVVCVVEFTFTSLF